MGRKPARCEEWWFKATFYPIDFCHLHARLRIALQAYDMRKIRGLNNVSFYPISAEPHIGCLREYLPLDPGDVSPIPAFNQPWVSYVGSLH